MNKKRLQKKIYRIGVDARFFSLENKGLGRYTNELVKWLDKIIDENTFKNIQVEYFVFLMEEDFKKVSFSKKNIHKIKANFKWYSWAEQLKFPFLLNKYDLDLVHFPHFNVPLLYCRKFLVTIHDLILFHYPTVKNSTLNKCFYWFKLLIYHLTIRIVVKKASLIIAISQFTKKDLIENLKVPAKKIKVIYEGADFSRNIGCNNISEERKISEKYAIMKPYLLYVGNAYPHKNLDRLVLAFKKINKNKKYQLVLIGKKDYFYKRLGVFIKKNQIENVVITDYVEDEILNCIYDGAKLFVFPSLYEGFGLPPLEALVRGLPTVSSNRSSLPEILGEQVVYFNPENVENIVEQIKKALVDECCVNKKDIKNLQLKFSWQKMVKEIVNIYSELLK